MLNRLPLAGAVFAAEGFLMERTDSLEPCRHSNE